MKTTMIAISAALTLAAAPVLAEDSVQLTTTKSTQGAVALPVLLGAMGAAVVVGIIATTSDGT